VRHCGIETARRASDAIYDWMHRQRGDTSHQCQLSSRCRSRSHGGKKENAVTCGYCNYYGPAGTTALRTSCSPSPSAAAKRPCIDRTMVEHPTASWQAMQNGNVFYRQQRCYTLDGRLPNLGDSVVAGCRNGGPLGECVATSWLPAL
jgi:hypothetical protein